MGAGEAHSAAAGEAVPGVVRGGDDAGCGGRAVGRRPAAPRAAEGPLRVVLVIDAQPRSST